MTIPTKPQVGRCDQGSIDLSQPLSQVSGRPKRNQPELKGSSGNGRMKKKRRKEKKQKNADRNGGIPVLGRTEIPVQLAHGISESRRKKGDYDELFKLHMKTYSIILSPFS